MFEIRRYNVKKYTYIHLLTIVFKLSVDLLSSAIAITRAVTDAHWVYRTIPVARQTDGRTMFNVHYTVE